MQIPTVPPGRIPRPIRARVLATALAQRFSEGR
jgi:hypothetical protein